MNKYFKLLPVWGQNSLITLYNTYQYRVRHGGLYKQLREKYKSYDDLIELMWRDKQAVMLKDFLLYVTSNSAWYHSYRNMPLCDFPVLQKVDVINHLDEIQTIPNSKGIISYTGGTTGASMKVIYTKKDIQERYAILDNFRSVHGYELGKKTAWFSGKNLVSESEVKSGICYRDDWLNNLPR